MTLPNIKIVQKEMKIIRNQIEQQEKMSDQIGQTLEQISQMIKSGPMINSGPIPITKFQRTLVSIKEITAMCITCEKKADFSILDHPEEKYCWTHSQNRNL